MNSLEKLKYNVINLLKNTASLKDVKVVEEYSTLQHNQVSAPIIAVGIKGASLLPSGMGGYFGTNEGAYLKGAWGEVVLRLDIYTSRLEDSPHKVFESMAEALFLSELGVTQIEISKVDYDKNAYTKCITATGKLQGLIANKTENQSVNTIVLKRSDEHK